MNVDVKTGDTWSILILLAMVAIIVLGGFILAMMAFRPKSDRPAAIAILVFVTNQFVWTYCRISSFGAADPAQSALWLRGVFASACLVGVGFLVIALAWTGRTRWLTFRRIAAFSLPSIVLSLSALTDGSHHLYFAAISRPGTLGGPTYAPGTLYPAYSLLTCVYVGIGIWLLLRFTRESAGWVRRRTIIILAASLPATLAGILMGVMGFNSWIDVTDLLILVASSLVASSFVRRWFTDIVGTGLAKAIDQMGDAVVIVDSGNRVVDINPAFCDFIQRSRALVIGQDVTGPAVGLLDNVANPNELQAALAATKANPNQPVDADLVVKDSPRRVYNFRVWPLHAEDGTFIGRVATLRDVSGARAAIRRLQELNTQMSEQTVELTRRAEQLATVNRVIAKQLVTTVSHELRTPLTPIIGYSEMLSMFECEPAKVMEMAGEINSAAMHMQALIDDLLDLSRIESGRLSLQREPIDIGDVIETVVNDFATVSKLHKLVVKTAEKSRVVVADRVRIRQVLDNLVSNAIKYSPRGGVVTIKVTTQSGDLRVAVSDQGPGIPIDKQGRLFEAFYRVECEMTRQVRGTGLGLAICHHLVELHGGRIWAESQHGHGSTFTFSLPLTAPVASPEPHPAKADDVGGELTNAGILGLRAAA